MARSLILFATTGMTVLAASASLVSIFVGLETMSICLYVLTGLVRGEARANESALKYFLLGAFSTGFFLYGIALIYGATGTMVLAEMPAAILVTGRTGFLFARAVADRVLLQGVGRAVPHVDARRVSGRADDDHRVHVHDLEDGGVLGAHPRALGGDGRA